MVLRKICLVLLVSIRIMRSEIAVIGLHKKELESESKDEDF